MPPTYRVRFVSGSAGRVRAEEVQTADYPGPLDGLAGRLPAGVYVLSVDDVGEDRAVHWTRWPAGLRPGWRDEATGRVVT